MNAQPYDGPERRKAIDKLDSRVRMLEELERAGARDAENASRQMDDLKFDVRSGFKEAAEAINDLGSQLHAFALTAKGSCSADDMPCPKGDIPWIKQWLTWIGAGEVALAAYIITSILRR